jgi:hypothetical protein
LSTIPVLLFSLKLIEDQHVDESVVFKVVSQLADLDELNNEFVMLTEKRKSKLDDQTLYAQELSLVNRYSDCIQNLGLGQMVALPGGFKRGNDSFYVIERTDEDGYRFVIINPSLSCQYHAARQHASGEVRYCAVMSVDHVPRDRILDKATLYYLVNAKSNLFSYSSVECSMYEVFIPSLLEELTERRIAAIELDESIADDEVFWVVPTNRKNDAAEWCALQLLFRYMVKRMDRSGRNLVDDLTLELYVSNLKRSIAELESMRATKILLSVTLGDKTALRAACRLAARHCLRMCTASGSCEVPPNVSNARATIETLSELLHEISDSVVTSDDIPGPLVAPDENSGTAPISSCLFPTWDTTVFTGILFLGV